MSNDQYLLIRSKKEAKNIHTVFVCSSQFHMSLTTNEAQATDTIAQLSQSPGVFQSIQNHIFAPIKTQPNRCVSTHSHPIPSHPTTSAHFPSFLFFSTLHSFLSAIFPRKLMSPATRNCSKIRHIVRVRQMLQRWRKKSSVKVGCAPLDVPAGHVAVCVGPSRTRFVVRAAYLNHPVFEKLLLQAEEEYGFYNQGPLTIPCDESLFQDLLRVMSRSESTRFSTIDDFRRRCHVDVPNFLDPVGESTPLLHDQLIC